MARDTAHFVSKFLFKFAQLSNFVNVEQCMANMISREKLVLGANRLRFSLGDCKRRQSVPPSKTKHFPVFSLFLGLQSAFNIRRRKKAWVLNRNICLSVVEVE